jgi:hypothetical protein
VRSDERVGIVMMCIWYSVQDMWFIFACNNVVTKTTIMTTKDFDEIIAECIINSTRTSFEYTVYQTLEYRRFWKGFGVFYFEYFPELVKAYYRAEDRLGADSLVALKGMLKTYIRIGRNVRLDKEYHGSVNISRYYPIKYDRKL